ncbi:hypothetical protein [Streptomyces sp. NPDC056291]
MIEEEVLAARQSVSGLEPFDVWPPKPPAQNSTTRALRNLA